MQRRILSFDDIDLGAIMVRMLIRYMWSEMDSDFSMPKRFQPARGVVFSLSSRWKKEMGDVVFSSYRGLIVDTTVRSVRNIVQISNSGKIEVVAYGQHSLFSTYHSLPSSDWGKCLLR